MVTVGKLVCVICGNSLEWTDKQQKSGQAKPSQENGWRVALPRHVEKRASLSCEQGRDGPILVVLLRLVAQVLMSVIV